MAFTDDCVGQVVAKLRQLGLYDDTLIVVTGDHGEMLGEHGELNHGFFIYEGALRVPLVMRVPRAPAAARQVDIPVSLIDIVPTILSLVGAEVPKEVQGVDLSPWLAGRGAGGAARPLYAETVTPDPLLRRQPRCSGSSWTGGSTSRRRVPSSTTSGAIPRRP